LILQKGLRLKLLLISFLMMTVISGTTYVIHEMNKINQQNKERQIVSDKVTTIMRLFNCNNQEIHDAIMDTFDPVLIAIVIGVESEYKVNAVSPAGCRGLMQLSPDKLGDWQNIHKNIQVGSKYLQEQMQHFGNLELAIAAYNAGPGSVSKYQGVPPFDETKAYVKRAKLLSLAFDHFLPWTTEQMKQML
jgi:hypothetical protein